MIIYVDENVPLKITTRLKAETDYLMAFLG